MILLYSDANGMFRMIFRCILEKQKYSSGRMLQRSSDNNVYSMYVCISGQWQVDWSPSNHRQIECIFTVSTYIHTYYINEPERELGKCPSAELDKAQTNGPHAS